MIFLLWCKVCCEDAPHAERLEITNPGGASCLCHGFTSVGSKFLIWCFVLSGVRGWGLWRLEIGGEFFNSVVMNVSGTFYEHESE